ncbi:hypothetical protein FFLO_00798 [Filobasidium floriforme]|uniref:Xylanolytic transcriptional activator regulatory domain-containing protein n=2 Tax=Filobasidium floriforme TaxID=5210 RepID=A0A8K0NTA1_9TREE|nr:hypothetical protein FFLO_00798 [Filobasidium floriforme]
MESSSSSSRRPQETGRDPDILFRNHHEPQQTIAAASHSVQAAGVIAEGSGHQNSTSSSSLPNPPAILGDKRKDNVEHYRRPLKSRALERQQSWSPSNLDFSYGHTNEARRPDQGQRPSRQRIESFAARRTDRPSSMSSVTPTTPNYPNSVQNLTTAVLPSNDQLLDSLPMATRLHDVLHSEAPIPAMSRLQPAGSRSMRTRIPSGVLPLESEASTLVSHFLDHTNTSLPILSKTRLWLQVEALYTNVHDVLKQEDVCLVFLVFACSASTIRGNCAETVHLKERAPSFWAEASKHLAACTAVDSVLRIEIMLLHLQYVMYNPAAGVVWDLAGATMRTVIDSGFHHETSSTGKRDDPDAQIDHQVDRRRRLFWSIYCIDRNLATALGRPPGIPDNWISAELPSVLDDGYIEGRGDDSQPSRLSPSKLATRHHIRIRRLQSEVHNHLYSAAVPDEPPPKTWFESVQSRLDQWREDWPAPTSFVSEEWLNLNYHMTVTLLLRPTAANPNPDRSQTQTALDSSSQVMRFYKDMFRKGRINYNWVAMYQLFINGVTYLNGLWQAHRHGWSIVPTLVDALLDIQGCSSIIEALAVITPGSSGIRNAFERVSEGVIRHLSQYSRLAGLSRQVSPSGSQSRPSNGTTTVCLQPPRSSLDNYTQTTVERLEPHDLPFAQVPQYSSGFPNIIGNEIALDESLVFGEHPFDDLLFRPLGDYTGDQWDEAVNSVLDQMAAQ